MVQIPDWREIEEKLVAESQTALLRFVQEHPNEMCSFFAYAWIPLEEEISLCLDTPQNALRQAQEAEQEEMRRRTKMLAGEHAWRDAHSYLCSDSIEYASGVDLFAYALYADIRFEGWQEFAESEHYPEGPDWADDYFEGNIRIVLWRVLERLIENEIFSSLHLSSPFRVGYQFHGDDLTVLRILNWPSAL